MLPPPVYFAFEITKSVWKLTCYVFTMHANGGRGWWQFHGKKTGRRMSRIWKSMVTCWLWRTRDESVVVNNHSFVVGDEGKIIHVESIWGQFHVRKTKNNEMPRLLLILLRRRPASLFGLSTLEILDKKGRFFFSNWSELRGEKKNPSKMILFFLWGDLFNFFMN